MDYLSICIRARLVHADLLLVDEDLRKEHRSGEHTFLLIKQSLICIKNLTDLLDQHPLLNREFPKISEARKSIRDEFEFCSYLRSRCVGHIDLRVIEKAIEWRPELRFGIYEPASVASNFIYMAILETTINTYVNQDSSHKIFSGDTDLIYPPDMERFLAFMEKTLGAGIALCDLIIQASLERMPAPPHNGSIEALELFKKSGQTDFNFLPGTRR